MRILRPLVAVSTVAALAAPIAFAAPTCTLELTRAACGGRIVAPPLQSVSFLQYKAEFKPVLDALEAFEPSIIDVMNIGKSPDNNDVYVVRVTDETVTTPKRQVALSLSVHGNESAGREGGIRYIEDLAVWWKTDRQRPLWAGEASFPLEQVLAETEIYFGFINPDGWADGDLPGSFNRGNGTGADLNRDYPTTGWTKQNQLAQPETRAWVDLVGTFPNLTTATDIHGELTSATNSFADIMYPADQWTPSEQAKELSLADAMEGTVERKFAEQNVLLQILFDGIGRDRTMKPATFATAFDIVGYDDSGFMGDWFAAQGATELDVENFLSHTAPNNVWFGPLEQAHVAAVQGVIEATIVESLVTDGVTAELDLGDVGYVLDPRRIEREASTPEGGRPLAAYSASRMDYFTDLANEVDSLVDPIDASSVSDGSADLSAFDSIVVSDDPFPPASSGDAYDKQAYIDALLGFAEDGGQLVLTDGAIRLLADGGIFPGTNEIKMSQWQGGKVDFGTLGHPWEEDLRGLANQTYYAVPLGYRSGSNIRNAPNWGIASTAWNAKEGEITVGTIDSGATINLGSLSHGAGSIAIFGSILPTQRTSERHEYGLADYAVTVSGGQVLHSILEYRRPTV